MFFINVHYPMNLDKIFQIFHYTNFHIIFPNLFALIAEATGTVTYSDTERYEIEGDNSETKFRLLNKTNNFLFNSGGMIAIFAISWIIFITFKAFVRK